MYEYLNRAMCSNQDRSGRTSVKSTITNQQCLHLQQNIIHLNPRSREFGQNSFSGMVQAYIQRMSSWTLRVMYLAALSCTNDFQSASAVLASMIA
jgi:hypothetical protein